MVDHRATVENGVNADKLFEAMEIEFENIIDDVEVENIRNVEDMDVEFENIENANIRDEVFEVLDEMEIDFENIMDQELSDEEILSDDSECASNMNKYEIDHIEKFVSQRCDKYIEQFEELCRAKRPRLAVGHRQSTIARIVRFAQSRNWSDVRAH